MRLNYALLTDLPLLFQKVPYKPNNVTVRVSTAAFLTPESPGEVPDRLDISWSRPSLDAATHRFETSDGGNINEQNVCRCVFA